VLIEEEIQIKKGEMIEVRNRERIIRKMMMIAITTEEVVFLSRSSRTSQVS
jgi:hypothetical protein